MAEGGDSVDSGQTSRGRWRDNMPDISSLYLGSDGIEPVRCREHGQEFKHFCKTHMTELCITCSRMEHKRCKTVIDIKDAAENIYSKLHGEKITQSVKDLNERFKDLKAAVEDIKSKLPIKTNDAIDKVRQKRKDIDAYLDKLEAEAVAEIRWKVEEYRKSIEEMIHVCEASLLSLSTRISDIERTVLGGNEEEKFIAINKTSIQTIKCCGILFDLKREIRDISINFEPNDTLPDQLKSLGTISVEMSTVTDVFADTTPIYTGEMEVKRDKVGDKVPIVTSFNVLQDGRKLVLDYNNNKIQLYDRNNTFVTETVLPLPEGEKCRSVVLNNNTEALVTTNRGRVFNVIIGDELAVSEIKTKYCIYVMTKYGEDNLCGMYHNDQRQICIIDKNMKNIIKTILKDDKTLFRAPVCLGFSADKNTIYVLDNKKCCYGITLDGRIMFNYQNQEADAYYGLVVDSDGLYIGTRVKGKYQVEKLNFDGERQELCFIFGDSWPLRLVENNLAVFQGDNRRIGFYSLLK